MYICLSEKNFKIESTIDLENVLQEFPGYRNEIFDQMGGTDLSRILSGPIRIQDMVKLFPEKEDTYFDILTARFMNRSISEIPEIYNVPLLKSILAIFPDRKHAFFNIILSSLHNTKLLNCINTLFEISKDNLEPQLVNFLSDSEMLNNCRELYILIEMFPEQGTLIFNYIFSKPENAKKIIKSFKDLNDAIRDLPDYKEPLYDIFIRNPSHFKRLITLVNHLVTVAEIFPHHQEIQKSYIFAALLAIEKQWQETQKQERNLVRKIYTQFTLLGQNNHPSISRLPNDILLHISSLATDPVVHDIDEQKKVTAQFHKS